MKLLQTKKDYIVFGLIITGIFLIVVFIINQASYFDPINWCYIKVEGDMLRGNEDTIRAAIKRIKKEDRALYGNMCRYVSRITEKNCIIADWHIYRDEFDRGWQLPGCYVRGSKNIYLKPEAGENETIIAARADVVKKFTEASREFWEEYKK